MRKVLLVACALVLGFGLTTSAVAGQKTMGVKKVTSMQDAMVARGTIVSVNTQDNSLVIKEQSGDVTFALAKDAKILKGSSAVTLTQLKAGQHVRVSYTTSNGRKTASHIAVWTGQLTKKHGTKATKQNSSR
jgi:hypothetical protein